MAKKDIAASNDQSIDQSNNAPIDQPNDQADDKTEGNVPFLKKITPYDKNGIPGALILQLGNGMKLSIHKNEVSPENTERCFWHGLSQKSGDAVSGFSKLKEYDKAEAAIREQFDLMRSTNWTISHAGGKRAETETSINDLIRAIVELKNLPENAVQEKVLNATREERDSWRKAPIVAKKLLEYELERRNAVVDSEEFDFPTI